MKAQLAALALLVPASAAHAVGWSSGQDRGIPFYSFGAGTLNLTIACDPEGIYQPPQQYIQATIAGKPVDGAVSLSGNGEDVTLPFESGTAFRQAVQPETWNKAMTVLHGPDGFSFGGQRIDTNDGPPDKLGQDCK